jgi:hypothetical protein
MKYLNSQRGGLQKTTYCRELAELAHIIIYYLHTQERCLSITVKVWLTC